MVPVVVAVLYPVPPVVIVCCAITPLPITGVAVPNVVALGSVIIAVGAELYPAPASIIKIFSILADLTDTLARAVRVGEPPPVK